jgi:hypothetical protein
MPPWDGGIPRAREYRTLRPGTLSGLAVLAKLANPRDTTDGITLTAEAGLPGLTPRPSEAKGSPKEGVYTEPKSEAGKRSVPIPAALRD